jgi:hypothetical protein
MTETGIKKTEDLDVETIKVVAQSICSGDWICPDCSPKCGVYNYAIKALTGSKECVHCINPYQEHNYNYCPYCGRKLKGTNNEKI